MRMIFHCFYASVIQSQLPLGIREYHGLELHGFMLGTCAIFLYYK